MELNVDLPNFDTVVNEVGFNNRENLNNQDPVVDFVVKRLQKDPEQFAIFAVNLLKNGVTNNSLANLLMGILHLQGAPSVPKDIDRALFYLKKSNDSQACYILGVLYLKGKEGVAQDRAEAIRWLQRASERGNASADMLLGAIFWSGAEDQIKNPEKAKTYLSRYVSGYYNYYNKRNEGISQVVNSIIADYALHHDPSEASPWIEKGEPAQKKDLYRRLGDMTFQKYGSSAATVSWKKMAELIPQGQPLLQEDKETFCKLGQALYHFRRDGKNFEEAVVHWRRAAEADYPMAQYYLGLAYCSGKGVAKDVATGKEWLQKASKSQFLPATAMLNHLEGKEKLSPKSLSEDPLHLSPAAERDCINAQKNFLGKVWVWMGEHSTAIIISTISAVAIAALVAGLIALTVIFPHVMIPIWIVAGGITGGVFFFGLLCAAGSGDRGALECLGCC